MMNLDRFLVAQGHAAGMDQPTVSSMALDEIRSGAKKSHWIWFVFPQGPFGESSMSRRIAIQRSIDAVAYLQHPLLRDRLFTITDAATSHLDRGVGTRTLEWWALTT